jgi:ABC-2 type transport system permease protein
VDGRFPGADGDDLLPLRLPHRHLGEGFEQLNFIPMLVITPLTFLGGAFYSIDMLPPGVAHFQPLQSRGVPHQRLPLELLRDLGGERRGELRNDARLLRRVPRAAAWIFKTGYRLKS